MKVVDEKTLKIIDVKDKPKPKKKFIYVLHDEGMWDFEQTNDIQLYTSFDKALNDLHEREKDSIEDIRNLCASEKEVVTNELIDRDNEYASFEVYKEDSYVGNHNTITINKKEVR